MQISRHCLFKYNVLNLLYIVQSTLGRRGEQCRPINLTLLSFYVQVQYAHPVADYKVGRRKSCRLINLTLLSLYIREHYAHPVAELVFLNVYGARNRFQGMNSAGLCSLAGRYNDPIPPQFLAPIDYLKIAAQALGTLHTHKTMSEWALKSRLFWDPNSSSGGPIR